MLDLPSTQAAGLLHLARGPGPLLLSVVSHGDERAELPLLWRLCTALVELGHPVWVLDATQSESADNPGLEQWLELSSRPSNTTRTAVEWAVVPSALGIAQICGLPYNRTAKLQVLGRHFEQHAIVVLYASASTQVQLLADTQAHPLLAASGDKSALLTSYLALKRLWVSGRLEPTILNMMPVSVTTGRNVTAGAMSNLEQCAKSFLGFDVNSIHLDPEADEKALHKAVRLLAMRMVESGLPLVSRPQESPVLRPAAEMFTWSGRH